MSFLRQMKYKDKSGKEIPISLKVDAANVNEDAEHRFITDTDKNNFTAKMNTNGNASNTTATFTAASTRANITSGEKLSVIFGKIAKYFADLKTVAFTGSYSDLSNKPTIPTVPSSLKNPYALKANGKTYDGSAAIDIGTMGVAYGGTGATTAANARTNLGLGAASTQGVANNLTTSSAGSVLDARQGKVLNDNIAQINGNITYINTNNLIYELDTIDSAKSWTATENCIVCGCMKNTSGYACIVYINSVAVILGGWYADGTPEVHILIPVCLPIKKGQTISVREYGHYQLKMYGLLS